MGIFFFQKTVLAAELYLSPENDLINQGQTVVVELRLDSRKEIINAVQGRMTYDPQILEFVEVSKAGTFLSLWPEEPKADTAAGVITFAGGAPNGSYVINGRVLAVVFKGKNLGSSKVSIDNGTSGVYLNDGLGTKAELNVKSATITVQIPTSTINLTSPTHPDENTWYKAKDVKFTWSVTQDAFYAYVFGVDPAALPDERIATHLGEISYSNVDDGIHYFILKEKLPNDKWGPSIRMRVQIDSTLPESIIYQLTQDVVPGKLVLVFSAKDRVSQIVKYQIIEGNQITDNAISPYTLKNQKQSQVITIKAFDSAGNLQEAVIPGVKTASTATQYLWPIAIGFSLVILVIILVVYWPKKPKRNLVK